MQLEQGQEMEFSFWTTSLLHNLILIENVAFMDQQQTQLMNYIKSVT